MIHWILDSTEHKQRNCESGNGTGNEGYNPGFTALLLFLNGFSSYNYLVYISTGHFITGSSCRDNRECPPFSG